MMPIPIKAAAGAGHLVRSKAATDFDKAGRHGPLAAAVARVASRCGSVKGVAATPPAHALHRGSRGGARGVATDPRGERHEGARWRLRRESPLSSIRNPDPTGDRA
jgi:hypothetical protein